ncbi:MAG: 16S rRNA (cytosine(1402)-N(4))-methyltransferase RsmH [Candidatus Omnitrophica bacterium]|nr:16S rRNA (cytosine(1402)-N(4))-methyltransferase RsmH [Candidatus Omnitrophota bacterium]
MDNLNPKLNNQQVKPKRRIRYKGSHPRHFSQKYKELNFEKYPLDVEKVIQSGKTPAGTHRPICVEEVLAVLKPLPGEIGLDATLGFGGHAVELLKRIRPKGKLFAMDVDPLELSRTEQRLRSIGFSEQELIIKRGNFAGMFKLVAQTSNGFDFILADLGVSSMQLDNPQRGFTYKHLGPLDLRLNPERGQPAAALLKILDAKQLEHLFIQNSDEPYARKIAQGVFVNRSKINTTKDLANVIANSLANKSVADCTYQVKDSIRRVFQALRIEVNDEFSVLEQFLRNLPFCLKPNGRAAILSFHPGEEKRIIDFFKQGFFEGLYSEISKEPLRPGAKEQAANPRSKSARLHWAKKRQEVIS